MSRLALACTALALTATPATAAVLVGDVVATQAAWSDAARARVTPPPGRPPPGAGPLAPRGGTADGYTMVVFDDEPRLAVGMRAEVTARAAGPGRWFADRVVDRTPIGRGPYVQTITNRSGRPLAWAKGCVQLAYAIEGTTAIPGDREREVIEAVIAHWNQPSAAARTSTSSAWGRWTARCRAATSSR